uniref:Uncharacterized protein n=1 Tax=Romanomermis culicivorax TaxID=13658 RepID=A0A915IJ02_ROMCU
MVHDKDDITFTASIFTSQIRSPYRQCGQIARRTITDQQIQRFWKQLNNNKQQTIIYDHCNRRAQTSTKN